MPVIVLCAIIGLLCAVLPGTSRQYRILAVFIVVTAVHSAVSLYYMKHSLRNHHLQNTYNYIRFVTLEYIYFIIFASYKSRLKWLPIVFWVLTPVVFLVEFSKVGFTTLHTTFFLMGASFTTASVLGFFFKIFSTEKILNPFAMPLFWTSVGLFFFFLCTMPSLGLITLLSAKDIITKDYLMTIIRTLSILLYSMIAVDFIIHIFQVKKSRAAHDTF